LTKPLRDVFGEALVELGASNPDVVVLECDIGSATRSAYFGKRFPDRFFNLGITEANMVSIAAGISTCGKIPFASTFSFLLTLRAADQIRSQISYTGLNVKLMGTNAGLSGHGDGVTHQSITDLAILRAMPRMTVVVPSDEIAVRKAVFEAAACDGPVFIRIPRVSAPSVHTAGMNLQFGKGIRLRKGADITIVAMGMMVWRALEAADRLSAEGIDAEVIEIHTIKPIDEKLIAESAGKTGAVVTAEEHNRFGGLLSAVAEVLGVHAPVPVEYVAIEDRYGGSGEYEDLMAECGLTVDHSVQKARRCVKRKRRG
jgi:transketolase